MEPRRGSGCSADVDATGGAVAADDAMPPAEHWDVERATQILGRTLLVGITEKDHDGGVLRRHQVFGVVTVADRRKGICVTNQSDGSHYWLPPDIHSIKDGTPGAYRNRTTGEVVVDPDFVTSWVFTEGEASKY
jgi:hypothetical protein